MVLTGLALGLPSAVTGLGEDSVGTDWILWSWTNPTDSDFNQSVISINGSEVATLDNTTTTYNATGLSPDTSYEISIVTTDFNGTGGGTTTDTATTASTGDTTGPAAVTSLGEDSVGIDWILWSWTNPVDSDFNQSVISINGSIVDTVDNTTTTYNATGLSSDTPYEISVLTRDLTGNDGSPATDSASTASSGDTTGPAAVTGLGETSTGTSWILWSWTNPTDSDFNQSIISIDGSEVAALNNTTTTYNATGLSSDTSYEISVLTRDLTGNDGGTATDSATTDAGSSSNPPDASFDTNVTDNEGSVPLIVQFNDTSTNNPTSWSWDFNDDGTEDSDEENPVHTFDSVGTYNVTLTVENGDGSDTATTTITVYSKTYYTGDRIWDVNADQSEDKYIWDAKSFSGFFYDLESGLSSENMTIYNIDRSLSDGDIVYQTRPVETDFELSAWGSYQVIGFMAEKYFAGYTDETDIDDVDEVSMLSSGQLSKILIDDDEEYSIFAGSSLELEEGYELNIVEVDVDGDSVYVTLTKDGDDVDSGVVESGDDYVYKDDLGDADDVAIVIIHIDRVFSGRESNAVFIEGIFQISDDYVDLDDGETYDEMEITSLSDEMIEMENEGTISLSKGDDINLMGSINLIVADDDDLRFAPYVDMSDPGTYELRGTVAEGSDLLTWTPLNFEGFYYDIDEGIQTEKLELTDISGRTIDDGDLVYTSTADSVDFERSGWGQFQVIGFMAKKYFAGYSEYTDIDGVDDISLISNGMLAEVLIDDDDEASITSGRSLELEEGYALNIVEVDIDGDSVYIELTKDGDEVDTDVIEADSDYVYEIDDYGDADDVPVIIIHFNNVFSGRESNAVFVEGIFQISDDYIELEDGETYDEMEITSYSDNSIVMKNEDSISLGTDDDITLMGEVGIRVADSSTLRYYPYVEETSSSSYTLDIGLSESTVTTEDDVTITVTARGATIADATIKLDDTTLGTTDDDGTYEYSPSEVGEYELTAVKSGYITGSKDFTVIDEDDASLTMNIEVSPDEVYKGSSMTIYVLTAIGGDAISGASVTFDGNSIGTTDSEGSVTYTTDEAGTHKIEATKDGMNDAELDFKVNELAAEFDFSNLQISPDEIKQGQEATITADVTNTGTAEGSYNVELKVDDVVVDSQTITLSVGNSTTVEFSHEEGEPGTYEVELGGLTTTYEVFEKSGTIWYVLGAIGLVAIGGVAYLFTAGGWTVEIAQAKAAEAIEAVKELIGK
jgi:S-layer protein (TIGR01567 family)